MLDEGLGSWPLRRARIAPDAVAMVYKDQVVTYGDVHDRVRALANGLSDLGVRYGDRVAYLGPNRPAFAETLFAVCSLGAVFVPLNTRLAAPELSFMLQDAGVEVLVYDPAVGKAAEELLAQSSLSAVVSVEGDDADDEVAFDALIDGGSRDAPEVRVARDDVAMLMYTSGTTGRPKAAVLTHANLTWNLFNVLIDVDLSSEDVTLVSAPMFHTAALNQTFLPTFVKGGTNILLPEFDPHETFDLIERHRVTWTFGVPAMFQTLANHPRWPTADLSSVQAIEAGGAPVPAALIRTYQDRGIVVMQGYGMTEASPGVLFLRARDSVRKAGTAGTPCFFTDVRLITPEGRDAAVGEPGEIHVQGPNVMTGYWGLPGATAEVLDDEGWFRSGDIAVQDVDGFLTIVDRAKDMFISGGENVYPAEIENALHDHPAIVDCAVVGIPDPRWGEVGHAFVVLEDGATLTREEMEAFLQSRLARYKIPKKLDLLDELPRNASGKLLKSRLTPPPE